MIIDLFVSFFRRRPEPRWIQEVGFSGCPIKSGMRENFGLSGYCFFPEKSKSKIDIFTPVFAKLMNI
jgi:hypothetical protein